MSDYILVRDNLINNGFVETIVVNAVIKRTKNYWKIINA